MVLILLHFLRHKYFTLKMGGLGLGDRPRQRGRVRRYAAEVDSSSIAKSPFIFSFRNGATSHTFCWRHHWWRAEADQDWSYTI
jgi:hypothetical protein